MSEEFFQKPPQLKNQFTQDPLLSRYLQSSLPKDVYQSIENPLKDLGEKASSMMLEWADDAEKNIPRHVPFDAWGNRIDDLILAQGWKNLESLAATAGVVATAYERKFAEFSRTFQMSLLYLYHPSSAIASCPLAMTDGAARAIELYGDDKLKNQAFKHLTSRDPQSFWTSGQWMTEKTGGSDVSLTSTIAKKSGSGYSLHGTKWFTSATTSQMAMTLARIEGSETGSRGLSLFYLETRNAQGKLNQIQIHRLKDKMGTKALPTAELTLNGTPAQLVGGEGGGVKKISSLFNITRVYNAICSIGQMRRAIELATEYAKVRTAFGKRIIDHPLHQQTLSDMQLEWMGCFHLVMKAVELLGLDELKKADEHQVALLRVLTPLAKLYCGKSVVSVCSEAVECFGGAGYVEDTGIPRLLRDGQVLAIWEGTTNVLSLDMLRAFEKENGFQALQSDLITRLKKIKNPQWQKALQESLLAIGTEFESALKAGPEVVSGNARGFSMTLTRIYIASLLCEFAEKSQNKTDLLAAELWLHRRSLKMKNLNIQESLVHI